MAIPAESVVNGLNDLIAAAKEMGDLLPREVGKTNKVAAQFIVDRAQAEARKQGGVAAKSAPAVKAAAQQRNVAIRLDGKKYPFSLGSEFGSLQFDQFKPWRGNQWTAFEGGVGYWLQPTIRDSREEFDAFYLDLLDDLAKRIFTD